MQKKTYNVGIIGAGFMGKTHTYNYMNLPLFYDDLPFNVKLVGICDNNLSSAEALKQNFGFEFATNNYMELMERKDIDIIDVSTPTMCHYEQIQTGLEAGKHLYIDKPLCRTVEEAEKIVKIAESSDCIKQLAYHYRFYPAMMKAKQLIEDGFIGKPLSFRSVYYHSSNLDPNKAMGWKQDKEMGGGGVLIEMACHTLDLMYHFLGEYEDITMKSLVLYPERPGLDGKIVKVQAEDHVLLTIKMKSGMLGTMEVSKVIAGSNDDLDFEIYGTDGTIKFNLMQPNFLRVYNTKDDSGNIGGNRGYKDLETINKYPDSKSNFPGPRFSIGWLRGHVESQCNFLRCIHSGQAAFPSLQEGVYIQKIVDRIYNGKSNMADISI